MENKEESLVKLEKQKTTYTRNPKLINPELNELSKDLLLEKAISILPSNYNFEILKTIAKIQKCKAKYVALQFPEGLMIYSTVIADILEAWTGAEIVIMGDVTYGGCCVDDYTGRELGVDLMVHYGHSCLVPISQTDSISCLYVFVDIQFDPVHLFETVKTVFKKETTLALVSIVQFVSSLQKVAQELRNCGYTIHVPQCHPLSPGEVLGCTSVPVPDGSTILALGDGRFHLESIMISNPGRDYYLYNPYLKVISREHYDHDKMKTIRKKVIEKASRAKQWGVILGTLGRQGSLKVLKNLENQLSSEKNFTVFFMSEIFPWTLEKIPQIDAWVQIACPRLSIDWGSSFSKPFLNPYEATVALKNSQWHNANYPMDFYAYESLGEWTPNHKKPCPCGKKRSQGCRGNRCKMKIEE